MNYLYQSYLRHLAVCDIWFWLKHARNLSGYDFRLLEPLFQVFDALDMANYSHILESPIVAQVFSRPPFKINFLRQ